MGGDLRYNKETGEYDYFYQDDPQPESPQGWLNAAARESEIEAKEEMKKPTVIDSTVIGEVTREVRGKHVRLCGRIEYMG